MAENPPTRVAAWLQQSAKRLCLRANHRNGSLTGFIFSADKLHPVPESMRCVHNRLNNCGLKELVSYFPVDSA